MRIAAYVLIAIGSILFLSGYYALILLIVGGYRDLGGPKTARIVLFAILGGLGLAAIAMNLLDAAERQ